MSDSSGRGPSHQGQGLRNFLLLITGAVVAVSVAKALQDKREATQEAEAEDIEEGTDEYTGGFILDITTVAEEAEEAPEPAAEDDDDGFAEAMIVAQAEELLEEANEHQELDEFAIPDDAETDDAEEPEPAEPSTVIPAEPEPEPEPDAVSEPEVDDEPEPKLPTWVQPIEGACPLDHPIKARFSTGRYHLPEDKGYKKVATDCCYATVEDAEADGFTHSRW